jgi:hypothetical protein
VVLCLNWENPTRTAHHSNTILNVFLLIFIIKKLDTLLDYSMGKTCVTHYRSVSYGPGRGRRP